MLEKSSSLIFVVLYVYVKDLYGFFVVDLCNVNVELFGGLLDLK